MSNPPGGVWNYEFSLPRDTIAAKHPRFRFRLGTNEWLCDRLAGRAEVVKANGKLGRLTLRGILQINDGVASMWAPEDAEPDPLAGAGVDSHWRLCYAREVEGWRLRDERKELRDPTALTIVKDYKGIVNLNWFDGGTHVFHDGKVAIDSKGVCHFGG